MTSSNGNIFRGTGPLWGESTGDRWIPRSKASDAELTFFFVEQTIETPMKWDAIELIMTSQECFTGIGAIKVSLSVRLPTSGPFY